MAGSFTCEIIVNIVLLTRDLKTGGAERVVTTLANHWAALGWRVRILCLSGKETIYEIDGRVTVQALSLPSAGIRLHLGLRRAICRAAPHVVVAFPDIVSILAVMATAGTRIPVVASERNHPGYVEKKLSLKMKMLRRLLLPRAAAVVFQTYRAKEDWCRRMHLRGSRTHVIPNPTFFPGATGTAPRLGKPAMVAMGRLVHQKGFDMLLKAFANVSPLFPAWRLYIFGEGEERADLERLRDRLGLGMRVLMPGVIDDVGGVFKQASLFVLSSRYEGFPNVLLEAKGGGLPVVAFDCEYGPREIVEHGRTGLLVPAQSIDSMSKALTRLIKNPQERAAMASAAARTRTIYKPERILPKWDNLLSDLAALNRGTGESPSHKGN